MGKKSPHFNADTDKGIDNTELADAGLDVVVDSNSDFAITKHKLVFTHDGTTVTLKGKFTWDHNADAGTVLSTIAGTIDDIDVRKNGVSQWQFHDVTITYPDLVADLNGGDPGAVDLFTTLFNVTKLSIDGTFFKDNLLGGDQNDKINAWSGHDVVNGAAGNDSIDGYNGNDTIDGGVGNDQLKGGLGQDHFVFDTTLDASTNVDHVKDFKPGEDIFDLSGSEFAGLPAGELASGEFYVVGTGSGQGSAHIVYDKATHTLYYDATPGSGDYGTAFATVAKDLNLSHTDFEVL